ncbi:glycosyltransferase family 4 protein [Sphingomonas sp. BT-65]|uniref:glycosyltransferase family 4 protein n=1 Tax=Sphingomonas sp. BT-65 TaxID=2989821 RepID=UPI002235B358|nr:glycosyltransferase family 4 protein [Sphingomonas sp. BT-65]MCW4463444.1 glycosyltransferase family 4 protein [Sphingomonas sp. BT-65]
MIERRTTTIQEGIAALAAQGHGTRAHPAYSMRTRICFPFAGGLIGGSHVSALKLVQSLDSTEFEPLVLLHSLEGPLRDFVEREGIRFELAPPVHVWRPGDRAAAREVIRYLPDVLRMRAYLKERDIRIVHTNEGPMHATWALPTRLAGARHIWHHRGHPRARGLRVQAPLLASRVLCVSNYAAPDPGFWSARRKSSAVYSPFDTSIAEIDREAARAALESRLGIGPETVVLAFLGHFSARKRPLIFVETIAALRQRRPNLPLVALMFGEEFEPGIEARLRARIDEVGVADLVRIIGFVQPVEPWLAASDALVVPAVDEPFGRTLVEAMLVGTPVVAAASGGNLEAIRNRGNGLLARVDDPADLAAHILELIDHPELAATIAHRAKQEALLKFSVGHHVKKVTAIYREVLAA